jgi:hypothetical protein
MTYEDKYKPSFIERQTGGILDTSNTEAKVERLNKPRANYCPTVSFLVEYSLREMCAGGKSE